MYRLRDLMKYRSTVILDSAMGTELPGHGVDISLPLWSAAGIVHNPDMVREIHIENIEAGADVITANTFRTQRRTLQKAGFKYDGLDYIGSSIKMTRIAVDLARDAVLISGQPVLIAGSIAPLEDCYHPELAPDRETLLEEHSEHYNILVQSGVDFLIAETLSAMREIEAVLEVVSKGTHEYCISLLCKTENELFSGEPLRDAVQLINRYLPAALFVNCVHPTIVEKIIEHLKRLTSLPLGVYANVGNPSHNEGDELVVSVSPREYLHYAKRWKKMGVRFIGGCCGTNPEYIKKISVLKN